jgi:hypothetical protein
MIARQLAKSVASQIARAVSGTSSDGSSIPALAIQDRAGGYILDRSGNYIVSRV